MRFNFLLFAVLGFCCISYSAGAVVEVKCEASKKKYFIEDASFCDRYYVCENSKATEEWCGDGLVFDTEKDVCDLPFAVKCGQRTKLQDPIPTDTCVRQNGMFPVVNSCDKFHHCTDGHSTLITCPGGTIFADDVGACVHADQSNRPDCVASDVLDFVCPNAKMQQATLPFGDHDRLPHPTSCRNFYMCLLTGQPRLGGCDYGLVFNPKNGRCDRPKKVPGCENWYAADEEDEEEDSESVSTSPLSNDAEVRKTVATTRKPVILSEPAENPSVKPSPTRRAGGRFRTRITATPKLEEE